jgi:hypothetical protein
MQQCRDGLVTDGGPAGAAPRCTVGSGPDRQRGPRLQPYATRIARPEPGDLSARHLHKDGLVIAQYDPSARDRPR